MTDAELITTPKIRRLKVRGLRSFVNETIIEFPENGLTLFRGRNLETGGSSGSGKSSLLLAIQYALGSCRYPSTALQSWLTEDPVEVSLTVTYGIRDMVITRGAFGLRIEISGNEVKGSAKAKEQALTDFFGLTPELLSAVTYRGQKQPGLFLSKTDSEKKEFLSTLLDLDKFEKAAEESAKKVIELTAGVTASRNLISMLDSSLNSLIASVKPPMILSEDKLKADLEASQKRRDDAYKSVLECRSSISSYEANVNEQVLRKRQEAQPALDALREQIKLADGLRYTGIPPCDRSILEQLQSDLETAQGFYDEELKKENDRSERCRFLRESTTQLIRTIEKRLATRPSVEKKLQQLMDSLIPLTQGVCNTCARPWDTEAEQRRIHLEIDSLEKTLKNLADDQSCLAEAEETLAAQPVYNESADLKDLRAVVRQLTQDIAVEKQRLAGAQALFSANQNKILADAVAAFESAKSTLAYDLERYRGDRMEMIQSTQERLEEAEREHSLALSQVSGLQAALNRLQIDNEREKTRFEMARLNVAKAQESRDAAMVASRESESALAAEQDFGRLMGREGFLGAIFDEVLSEISTEANALLAQFPNTAHVTVEFKSESVSQKGVIKKSIVPMVTIGGYEAPLSSGLSGGMESAVELAVDLAVSEVVSRRTGSLPGWLILDESFTGLGPVEAEACMEILQGFAKDKLVLVVDHASEMKSLFTQFVDIEFKNGASTVAGAL